MNRASFTFEASNTVTDQAEYPGDSVWDIQCRCSFRLSPAGLIARGLSPAEAVDYLMVEERGYRQTEWAAERGTFKQAVSKDVGQAAAKLSQ